MIDNPCVESGNMAPNLRAKARELLKALESAIAAEAAQRRIPRALLPALMPSNVLCALSKEHVSVVFTSKNAGQLPRQVWIDVRDKPIPGSSESEFLVNYAVYELGFENPRAFQASASMLDLSGSDRDELIRAEAADYVNLMTEELSRPRAIAGYEGLQPLLDAFSIDHPKFDRNVFIAMRFRSTEQFAEIDTAVRDGLRAFGLDGHRADGRMYATDGDLWNNVCVYMMGCKYATCIFEEIDEREFNPNVAIEYGFLRAINRQILLLKEQRVPTMPTDMVGKMYRAFNGYKIAETISAEIANWAERDLGLKPKA